MPNLSIYSNRIPKIKEPPYLGGPPELTSSQIAECLEKLEDDELSRVNTYPMPRPNKEEDN